MIGMCPSAVQNKEYLIRALHLFKARTNFTDTYVALTVFDGARGYIDILPFTNNRVRP